MVTKIMQLKTTDSWGRKREDLGFHDVICKNYIAELIPFVFFFIKSWYPENPLTFYREVNPFQAITPEARVVIWNTVYVKQLEMYNSNEMKSFIFWCIHI